MDLGISYWSFFLDENSSLVANVQNLSTGYISPQYHHVFDDCLRRLWARDMMILQLIQFLVLCLILIRIGMPNRNMILAEIRFIDLQPFMMYGFMNKDIIPS